MNDAAALESVTLEGGDHVGVAAPHVQQGGQVEVGSQLQLSLENRLLTRFVEVIEVVIETDLAHRT